VKRAYCEQMLEQCRLHNYSTTKQNVPLHSMWREHTVSKCWNSAVCVITAPQNKMCLYTACEESTLWANVGTVLSA